MICLFSINKQKNKGGKKKGRKGGKEIEKVRLKHEFLLTMVIFF